MYIFGSGSAFATPYGASAAGSPTPMQLGILQETSVDFNGSQKELMGKFNFAVAIARTTIKLDLKFKFANQYVKLWNDTFFSNTVATGEEIGVPDSAQAPTAGALTVVPPASGTFARDLGARDAATGIQLIKDTSGSPAAGHYKATGAAYTFNAAQVNVLVSYTYTLTTGASVTVTNQAMGTQPVLDVTVMNSQYVNLDNSVNCLLRFPAVIASKMSMPMKNEDWLIEEFDCGAFADAANRVMYINADE